MQLVSEYQGYSTGNVRNIDRKTTESSLLEHEPVDEVQ
jgi:hypothetical protein